MSFAEMDPREVAKAQVKGTAPEVAPTAPAEPPPAVPPPSLLDARRRQAARVREATVARWLRRLSA